MKIKYEVNFTRSAKLPVINAGVMMANFSWNKAKSKNGKVGANNGCGPRPTL